LPTRQRGWSDGKYEQLLSLGHAFDAPATGAGTGHGRQCRRTAAGEELPSLPSAELAAEKVRGLLFADTHEARINHGDYQPHPLDKAVRI